MKMRKRTQFAMTQVFALLQKGREKLRIVYIVAKNFTKRMENGGHGMLIILVTHFLKAMCYRIGRVGGLFSVRLLK